MTTPKWINWKTLLAAAVTILCIWLAVHQIDPQAFFQALGRMHVSWWLAGVGLYGVSHLLRAVRWRAALRPALVLSPIRLFPYTVIGLVLDDLLPGRLGDLYRAWLVTRRDRLPYPSSLAVVAVERIFDGLAVLLQLAVVLSLAELENEVLGSIRWTAVWIFGLGGGVLLAVAFFPKAARVVLEKFGRLLPEKFNAILLKSFEEFERGLAVIRSPLDLLWTLLTTVAVWLAEGLFYWMVFQAFDLPASLSWALLVNAVVALSSALPAAPAALGVFHYACVLALGVFGVEASKALAIAVVLHTSEMALTISLGAIFAMMLNVSVSNLRRLQPPDEE